MPQERYFRSEESVVQFLFGIAWAEGIPYRTFGRWESALRHKYGTKRFEADIEKGPCHMRHGPFEFWLPDLDSNQGPAD
jgi:hypothetical protein